ncbi:hypothetical protein ACP70R_007827 [Stipagrostis hirtigluma subsp. patula]
MIDVVTAAAKEEGEAKPAVARRRMKTVRVKQEYIDLLLERPPKPFCGMAPELIDKVNKPKLWEELRSAMASMAAPR